MGVLARLTTNDGSTRRAALPPRAPLPAARRGTGAGGDSVDMSAGNEAYTEGMRLLKELGALRADVLDINASDTQCKERVLQLLEQSRERLREAMSVLSGLV